MMRSLIWLWLVCVACSGPSRIAAPPVPEAPEAAPCLVVAVVLDQLGFDTLERYLPYLDEDGALRTLQAQGAFHEVEFQHAATFTAAGHASIHTGASPREHGVMSNRVFDASRGEIASCDDGRTPVFGAPERFASPSLLRVPTVADALRAAHPEARVVALSFKDRASVIPGGQQPTAVAFWDKGLGRFTSSAFYSTEPPAWLDAFHEAHPAADRMAIWEPGDPVLLERVLGPDARRGEGGLGYSSTFPHDPRDAGDEPAASAFRGTPQASEYLLDLARAAVAAFELGADEVPDLLSLSISGTDYVGHAFGLGSWEYLDNLIRVDRALGRFLAELNDAAIPFAVLVTSDHGHADVPEALSDGGRVLPSEILPGLEAAMDRAHGERNWFLSYTQPFIYLAEEAQGSRELAVSFALNYLRELDGVARVFDVRERAALRGSDDPLERLVYESIGEGPPGDVFVVLEPGHIVDDDAPFDTGASHGTPYAYDRRVPAIFAGPGVRALRGEQVHDQRRVARTIADLLGIAGPSAAPPTPLPGSPGFSASR